MERLDELGCVGRVAQGIAQALDRRIQPALEVHIGVGRPKPLAQLVARDQLAGVLEQEGQNLQRLVREVSAPAALPKLTRPQVQLEDSESDDVRFG